MTEKEKCNTGQLYNANYDTELLKERSNCKDLCFKFNQLLPSNEEEQTKLLKKIIGKTGNSFVITAPFWCDYGYNIEIGENFYTNHNCVILDGAKVTFGDNVIIVTRDIPTGVIAVGNPCRILRKINNKDTLKYRRIDTKD
ncbi:maltose acetyltransferase domain-containing protein [uncultured Cetobacterium sp.]|uniref:maltose acetyltransferase domain-containing protein n=1 Tax=uncultured Cetobacterium sp. TaxID=527638 RepID=UPI00260F5FE0|nr:maltose acetyltransferase domain-containing protein [uncultured Cetobacterium sp.]